jgi:hypothetical protein
VSLRPSASETNLNTGIAHLFSALTGILSTVLGWIAVPGHAALDILGCVT